MWLFVTRYRITWEIESDLDVLEFSRKLWTEHEMTGDVRDVRVEQLSPEPIVGSRDIDPPRLP